jgi:hypothetical protein
VGKVAEDLCGNFSVRERVDMLGGLLREIALGLRSPVLALASQNRSAGNYGNGKGSAALDSLKESGALEAASDGGPGAYGNPTRTGDRADGSEELAWRYEESRADLPVRSQDHA